MSLTLIFGIVLKKRCFYFYCNVASARRKVTVLHLPITFNTKFSTFRLAGHKTIRFPIKKFTIKYFWTAQVMSYMMYWTPPLLPHSFVYLVSFSIRTDCTCLTSVSQVWHTKLRLVLSWSTPSSIWSTGAFRVSLAVFT